MKVGVVRTEEEIFGERVVDTLKKYGKHKVHSTTVQKGLPEFVDHPETYLEDRSVFESSDLIISCVFYKSPNYPYSKIAHPDLTECVADFCEEHGKDLIAPRTERGLFQKDYSIRIASPGIACELKRRKGGYLGKLTKRFGPTDVKIEAKNDKVKKVEVVRGALCGVTWYVAEKVEGRKLSEVANEAVRLQQPRCTAPRAFNIFTREERGLHRSGELLLKAMERAIKK